MVINICIQPLDTEAVDYWQSVSEGFDEYKSRYKFKLKLLNRNVPVFENFDLAGKVLDKMNTYREFLQKYEKYPKSNN